MKNNLGKKFEENFKNSALKQEMMIIRFKDTSSSWSSGEKTRFTCDNPCDFEIYSFPFLFLLK